MVAHFTMRTYGVNQAFQFVEGMGYVKRVVKSDRNTNRHDHKELLQYNTTTFLWDKTTMFEV